MSSTTDAPHHEWSLVTSTDLPSAIAPSKPEPQYVHDGDFSSLFKSDFTRNVIGSDSPLVDPAVEKFKCNADYAEFVSERIFSIFNSETGKEELYALMSIGVGALHAFLQSNVTGPPLPFSVEGTLLPSVLGDDKVFVKELNKACITSLTVDGESAYHLAPNTILLVLAKTVLNHPVLFTENADAPETVRWWRLRVNFHHQRILSEATGTLHNQIYEDVEKLIPRVFAKDESIKARFLVEKAMVDTYYSHDIKALKGLEEAANATGLKYALTGVLGKRTKFQQHDVSQLVVLAKSKGSSLEGKSTKPKALDLNDDTLLESIAFTKNSNDTTRVQEASSLPEELAELDPGEQPMLDPLDSAILLLLTETIKNTNPESGITREEMLPYAERVLKHSTNWEVYTLGLLIRSRIEGYKTRTVERGVLQLQVVVDQVIAETTGAKVPTEEGENDENKPSGATTFLPKAKEEESAPIKERLAYIHQLPVPTRWELEAELAQRWVTLGGFRTALAIYERLEMWAEVALCWAATEREDKARKIIRDQLFHPVSSEDAEAEAAREERDPPPTNAPRLWSILGDIEVEPAHYERAWEVSKGKYSRAKRSLARHYFSNKEFGKAAEAYVASLRINPLNGPSWFALGCCWLELENWEGAAEAFSRTVGIDENDAEAWSNLATALLRRETKLPAQKEWNQGEVKLDDEEADEGQEVQCVVDEEKNKRDALKALKRASSLKYDSWRIWENLLIISASVNPPSYTDVVVAMKRVLELRKDSAGETAVDVDILEMLVRHVITSDLESDTPKGYDPSRPGLAKMVVELVEKDVVPVITTNPRLWKVVAKLALWRKKPKGALEAHEKAWRVVNSRPGITEATEKQWNELVEATVELVDAYASLGEMTRTEGLGAGEMVAKDWRFKARTAIRGVMGRGGDNWEGTKGWEQLQEALEGLKA
ncbi:hypothetical protein RUND412_006662 [Rhizina undulata]